MMVSFFAKIGTRRLLAQGILRAGLPIPCGTVATGSELLSPLPGISFPSQLRVSRGISPLSALASPPNNKKIPGLLLKTGD